MEVYSLQSVSNFLNVLFFHQTDNYREQMNLFFQPCFCSKSKGKVIDVEKQITIDTTHGSSNLNVFGLNIDVTYGNSGGPLLNKDNEVVGMLLVKEKNKNGDYPALANDIASDGDNWWCVLFPPLCTNASMDNLSSAGVNQNDTPVFTQKRYILRFKFLEWFR